MGTQIEMFNDSITDSAYINYINDCLLFSNYRMVDKFLIQKVTFWSDFPATFSIFLSSINYGNFTVSNKFEKEITSLMVLNNKNFCVYVKSDYPQKVAASLSGTRYREFI